MNDKVDGAESPPVTSNKNVQTVTIKQAQAMIDAQINQIMGILIRGIIVSSQGVPAIILLPAIARACGLMIAQALIGNTVENNLNGRRDVKKAFEEGLAKISALQPANAMPAPGMTAPFNGSKT